MIFSKDKRPTEPGLYWCLFIASGTVQIADVIKIAFNGRLGVFVPGNEVEFDVYDENFMWGDRIETPVVEAAP